MRTFVVKDLGGLGDMTMTEMLEELSEKEGIPKNDIIRAAIFDFYIRGESAAVILGAVKYKRYKEVK